MPKPGITIRLLITAISLGVLFLRIPPMSHVKSGIPDIAMMDGPAYESKPIDIPLNVRDGGLPVSIGVPLAESNGLSEVKELKMTGPDGKPVAASFKVLSRWRAERWNNRYPVKWLLVDFAPSRGGIHHLTSSGAADVSTDLRVEDGDTIRVSNRRLSVEIATIGENLIKGFRLDGVERMRAGMFMKLGLPAAQSLTAVAELTQVEERSPLRVVVRQYGTIWSRLNGGRLDKQLLNFTIRYHFYAGRPYVRAQMRLVNFGSYGFLSNLTGLPARHLRLRSLTLGVPTVEPGKGETSVLTSDDAHSRLDKGESIASISAGGFELSVPEFVENFPRRLIGEGPGLRFDILPETGEEHQFDGARAKTVDFYLGSGTVKACNLTTRLGASLDPAYIASTGAVRPSLIEKRDWREELSGNPQMQEAAERIERMHAVGYAVEAAEGAGAVPPESINEYRLRSENGEQFGWRNFGDLAWGDGYANVHYDLPFILLREYLRTGDDRAFIIGSQMARYRRDWGQHQSSDPLAPKGTPNFRGMAFYEKGDHGSFREPVPSHMWIEGLWLHWALTGDQVSYQMAVDGSDALAVMEFTYDNALSWNEPRWVGWPILGLMAAWRYTGESQYIVAARRNIALLIETEERGGPKGYYIGRDSGFGRAVQPWMWGGYTMLGVIEFWRDTGDRRTGEFLVRVADWLTDDRNGNAPLKPGRFQPDGIYRPAGVPYFWYPDITAPDSSTALAGLCLPVLTTAARISGRDDLWRRAGELFRDFAFYRDLPEGNGFPAATRGVINFRSLQFPGSVPKVYGQMGLTVEDFLADYLTYRRALTGSKRKDNR
ncbi:MAG: hypothetical protein AB7H86_14410 [Blastocatellales bacterium]